MGHGVEESPEQTDYRREGADREERAVQVVGLFPDCRSFCKNDELRAAIVRIQANRWLTSGRGTSIAAIAARLVGITIRFGRNFDSGRAWVAQTADL